MKQTSKRIFLLLLALIMALSVTLAGCTPSDNTDDGTGSTGDPADPTGTEPDNGYVEGQVYYTFAAKSMGGMYLSGVTVVVTDAEGNEVTTGTVGDNGTFSAWLWPAEYTVTLTDLKQGYSAESVKTGTEGGVVEIIAQTQVITGYYPQQPSTYALGDVMWDFSFTKDGQEVRLSELLETKDMVILNLWYDGCGFCALEFPVMQTAYEQFEQSVEIVALSPYDDAAACEAYKQTGGYTFNMVPDIGFTSSFSVTGFPTTVYIDRYGIVTYIHGGAVTDIETWLADMALYTSDDYSQSSDGYGGNGDEAEKPDVEMPDSALIEEVLNGTNYDGTKFGGTYTPSADEYVWPWVVGEDGGYIEPSNYGKASSTAMISTEVYLEPGEILAFDYEYSIEYDKYGYVYYDLFAVYVDGHIMQSMFTVQDGKVTCYVYSPLEAGTYTITLAYVKNDNADGWGYMESGKEYIHVSNMRVLATADLAAANASVDVWRAAATGEGDDTTRYGNYVTVVLNENDGYYHVGTADGPLLLAKLTGATQWSSTSLELLGYYGKLVFDGVNYYDTYFNAETYYSYTWLESEADLHYCPVNEELSAVLDLVASEGDGNIGDHEWEWLEFCCYFDHYGVGEGIMSPSDLRSATDKESAYDAVLGVNHFFANHAYVPRGSYYKFIPEETAIYHIYVLEETADVYESYLSTILWIFEGESNDYLEEYGDDENFNVYKKLEAGKTYYIVPALDPVDNLGGFDFVIEKTDLTEMDKMKPCTDQYTTTKTEPYQIIVGKHVDAVLGEDGYYHVLLADGTPDYSDTGFVYVDFLGESDFMSTIGYKNEYCSLYRYLSWGYAYLNEDGEIVFGENAFDFENRIDLQGTDWVKMGNYQAEMEAYLEQAMAGDPEDLDYGYVKATPELIEILECLIRLYGMVETDGETLVADQWLMFCSYVKHA